MSVHITIRVGEKEYEVDLNDAPSKHTDKQVQVGGRAYAVLGPDAAVQHVVDFVNSPGGDPISSIQDLKSRLSVQVQHSATESVAKERLRGNKSPAVWMQRFEKKLPAMRREFADKCCEEFATRTPAQVDHLANFIAWNLVCAPMEQTPTSSTEWDMLAEGPVKDMEASIKEATQKDDGGKEALNKLMKDLSVFSLLAMDKSTFPRSR